MRGVLFLNPSSGTRVDCSAFETAAAAEGLRIVCLGPDVDCAAIVREEIARDRRLFIAAGGDGTINAVAQPLINSDAEFAVIPVGTYNHFARDLGIPLDWRAALDIALSGERRQIDAGRVNDRFFLNNVSIGLYPELVARREEKGRDYPRWKARLHAAYTTLRKYPHVTLAIESEYLHEIVKTHVFLVSNNSYDLSRVGVEAPRGTLEEGRLSVYWLPHMPRIRLTRFLAHYLAGRVKETPGFRSFRTVRLKVQSARKRLQLGVDGEVVTMPPPLMITIVPKALTVKVPRS
ncbi:MAG TPA: diacylglycerol kinase family protein [Thermoanaerobaculia bacterium]|nr:diacylglycerol kinase family protein [Thermoanaerobaculia bacterium]